MLLPTPFEPTARPPAPLDGDRVAHALLALAHLLCRSALAWSTWRHRQARWQQLQHRRRTRHRQREHLRQTERLLAARLSPRLRRDLGI